MKNSFVVLLVLIAILVSGIAGYGFAPMKTTYVTLPDSTRTTTTNKTVTVTATSNSPYSRSIGVYSVTFQQSPCNPTDYVSVWSVTLANETVLNPYNGTLPLSGVVTIASFPSDSSISTITFVVPDGTFNYTVKPTGGFSSSTSGIVVVKGSSVAIRLDVVCHP
ncbi:MAG: hypothetical protein JRN20_18110 [Nitrososphaerota archaeon]|nr:hypothetical protein [Nitrososphaerota archaeon]